MGTHFAGTDACVAPILDLDEAPVHPHNIARRTFLDVEGVFQPAPAPRYSGMHSIGLIHPAARVRTAKRYWTSLAIQGGNRPAPERRHLALNPLYESMQVSVFERMSSLAAAKHGAVNLGQGFPDFGWPEEILDAAARALKEGSNQYAPSRGLPQLRQAIADHYGRHFGQRLDPPTTSA